MGAFLSLGKNLASTGRRFGGGPGAMEAMIAIRESLIKGKMPVLPPSGVPAPGRPSFVFFRPRRYD